MVFSSGVFPGPPQACGKTRDDSAGRSDCRSRAGGSPVAIVDDDTNRATARQDDHSARRPEHCRKRSRRIGRRSLPQADSSAKRNSQWVRETNLYRQQPSGASMSGKGSTGICEGIYVSGSWGEPEAWTTGCADRLASAQASGAAAPHGSPRPSTICCPCRCRRRFLCQHFTIYRILGLEATGITHFRPVAWHCMSPNCRLPLEPNLGFRGSFSGLPCSPPGCGGGASHGWTPA